MLTGILIENSSRANHAQLYNQGVGFVQINGGQELDVYIHEDVDQYAEAVKAIEAWRALRFGDTHWWFQQTFEPAGAEVEIMDKGSASLLTFPTSSFWNKCAPVTWSGIAWLYHRPRGGSRSDFPASATSKSSPAERGLTFAPLPPLYS
jgi:hypothetical protein